LIFNNILISLLKKISIFVSMCIYMILTYYRRYFYLIRFQDVKERFIKNKKN